MGAINKTSQGTDLAKATRGCGGSQRSIQDRPQAWVHTQRSERCPASEKYLAASAPTSLAYKRAGQ
jgi:hypothetical protein